MFFNDFELVAFALQKEPGMRNIIKHDRVIHSSILTLAALLLSFMTATAQVSGASDVTVNTVRGYDRYIPYDANNTNLTAGWTDIGVVIVAGQHAHFGQLSAHADIRFPTVGSFTVQCCIEQTGSCASMPVVVHPMAPTIVSVTPAVVCQTGGTVSIKVSDPYPTAGTNQYRLYASNTDPTPIATISTDTFQPSISGNTTFYVTTLNSLGGESLTRTPVSVTFSTNTAATPGVSTVYGIVGGQVMVTASGAGSGVSYRWLEAGSGPARITTENNTIYGVPSASTSTFVSVQLDNGVCQGPAAWIPIVVYPRPLITGTAVTMGEQASLACDQDLYDSYTWYRDGAPVATGRTLVTDVYGVYKLKVTKNGASGESESYTVGAQFAGVDENYVVSDVMQVKGITTGAAVEGLTRNSRSQSVQYFDGLGRPMQAVSTQGSPSGKDVVQPVVYDDYGREAKKYLPVVLNSNDGWYKPGIINNMGNYSGLAATNPYNNGSADKVEDSAYPYTETILESSPLNRVLRQGAPGEGWQPGETGTYANPVEGDHSIKKDYAFNGTNEVLLLDYDETTQKIALGAANYYSAKELHASKTKDEHNHEVIEYVDKEGRTLLKKVETVDENGATTYAETYYVYDDFGNLVVVLPPEATKRLKTLLIP
jgi:hypothetical protein